MECQRQVLSPTSPERVERVRAECGASGACVELCMHSTLDKLDQAEWHDIGIPRGIRPNQVEWSVED